MGGVSIRLLQSSRWLTLQAPPENGPAFAGFVRSRAAPGGSRPLGRTSCTHSLPRPSMAAAVTRPARHVFGGVAAVASVRGRVCPFRTRPEALYGRGRGSRAGRRTVAGRPSPVARTRPSASGCRSTRTAGPVAVVVEAHAAGSLGRAAGVSAGSGGSRAAPGGSRPLGRTSCTHSLPRPSMAAAVTHPVRHVFGGVALTASETCRCAGPGTEGGATRVWSWTPCGRAGDRGGHP